METKTEVWLRGSKTPGLAPQLQPAADALLQTKEEIRSILEGFPEALLWERPAGLAAVGFHLKHIAGVLDRLLTYAEGAMLSEAQFIYLKSETVVDNSTIKELLEVLENAIDTAIDRYKKFEAGTLTEERKVGRAGLPATVFGLCFHAAEHTMRHLGQLLVTVKVLRTRHDQA
ncbi:DinB family protein [Niabella soli]|uniref:Metal-dependent hydrolase n=1 Tax=Niabella soli DSM 19437 TaxID=929713 RepID=W0EWW9_9BACT|nr:DinB family protein [Niabella soli]AHF15315.1 metal-dependent hydrolase [Niabella soli DSM 19437]